jgi:hypothetical protein
LTGDVERVGNALKATMRASSSLMVAFRDRRRREPAGTEEKEPN